MSEPEPPKTKRIDSLGRVTEPLAVHLWEKSWEKELTKDTSFCANKDNMVTSFLQTSPARKATSTQSLQDLSLRKIAFFGAFLGNLPVSTRQASSQRERFETLWESWLTGFSVGNLSKSFSTPSQGKPRHI